jgi:hypothetical protein
MNAKVRGAIYGVAVAIGALLVIVGWVNNDQVDAWLRVLDSLLSLILVAAPALALKNLTPDAPKE